MITNYHTHTKRCNHAYGEDVEYIKKAIEKNIEIIAFTEHMPDKDLGDEYRPTFDGLNEYIKTFEKYKEKYKDKIRILIGLECEYFKENDEFYRSIKNDKRVDLLVLGHHLYPDKIRYYNSIEDSNQFNIYRKTIIEAMETGYFHFVAHPDLFLTSYPIWDKYCEETTHAICETASKLDLPLEVNSQGIRSTLQYRKEKNKWLKTKYDGYYYPNENFWKIAKEYNNKVIVSGDYHSPLDIEDECVKLAREFAKELNLNVIEKLNI